MLKARFIYAFRGLRVKWQKGSPVIFSGKTQHGLLVVLTQWQEEGCTGAGMKRKPRTEVTWAYCSVPPDGRWAEHSLLVVVQRCDMECIRRCSAEMGKKNEEQWWVDRVVCLSFRQTHHHANAVVSAIFAHIVVVKLHCCFFVDIFMSFGEASITTIRACLVYSSVVPLSKGCIAVLSWTSMLQALHLFPYPHSHSQHFFPHDVQLNVSNFSAALLTPGMGNIGEGGRRAVL